jgi:serine/threonine-protein kinase
MNQLNAIAGRYRLIREIGRGGLGTVWEAENLLTRRHVALKLMLNANEQHRRRLLHEAKACGRLSHRNIIEVLDVGETERREPFLVMPLLKGETLADFLTRKRRLAPWLAAQICRDIAMAVSAAHVAGIIHRDLKPGNIFLHREGGSDAPVIKVLDFGICKELDPKATVLTLDGKCMGTPPYMSPEQFTQRAALDHRTDIWSMGAILFEMLTGVRPFTGKRVEEVIGKIISGPIPTVSQLVRTVDSGLVKIVSRCLTRDREQRIGSAEELAELLAPYTDRTKAQVPAETGGRAPSGTTDLPMTSAITQGLGATSFGLPSPPTTVLLTNDESNAKTLPFTAAARANGSALGKARIEPTGTAAGPRVPGDAPPGQGNGKHVGAAAPNRLTGRGPLTGVAQPRAPASPRPAAAERPRPGGLMDGAPLAGQTVVMPRLIDGVPFGNGAAFAPLPRKGVAERAGVVGVAPARSEEPDALSGMTTVPVIKGAPAAGPLVIPRSWGALLREVKSELPRQALFLAGAGVGAIALLSLILYVALSAQVRPAVAVPSTLLGGVTWLPALASTEIAGRAVEPPKPIVKEEAAPPPEAAKTTAAKGSAPRPQRPGGAVPHGNPATTAPKSSPGKLCGGRLISRCGSL